MKINPSILNWVYPYYYFKSAFTKELSGSTSSQHTWETLRFNKYRFQVNNNHQPATTTATSSPLVLSLSQIQGSGGLLILNSGTHSPALAPVRSAKDKAESMEVTWWFMSRLALVLWWFLSPLSVSLFIPLLSISLLVPLLSISLLFSLLCECMLSLSIWKIAHRR